MKDFFYTIIGLATIALIIFVSVKGFLSVKRKHGFPMAILVSVLLFAIAIVISLLTTIY